MTAERLISGTVPTIVGAAVVGRITERALGGSRGSRGSRGGRSTRRGSSGRESSRRTFGGGHKGSGGGGGVTHYPANRIRTLCGKKLKDVDHTRVVKNVDCKRCHRILKSMGRVR